MQYIDISPKQMVGVSAGLIPFLEHDDANRALMGSNMQRQAVPLLVTEPPIVSTGLEKDVAYNSGMVVRAEKRGTRHLCRCPAHPHRRARVSCCASSPDSTSTPASTRSRSSSVGQKVKEGEVIADGAATQPRRAVAGPQRAGRVHVVGRLQLRGRHHHQRKAGREDTYTSIHIEEFEIEIRETKLGKEEFTRDIPNVSPKALSNLDEYGIVRIGTFVQPGDILVGKVSPKSKSELTPEEKLLHAIFGRAGEDVKNDSLDVPSGVEGIVIDTQRFSRRASMTEDEKKAFDKEQKEMENRFNKQIADQFRAMIAELAGVLEKPALKDNVSNKTLGQDKDDKAVARAGRSRSGWITWTSAVPSARSSAPRSIGGTRNGWTSCSTRRSASSTR